MKFHVLSSGRPLRDRLPGLCRCVRTPRCWWLFGILLGAGGGHPAASSAVARSPSGQDRQAGSVYHAGAIHRLSRPGQAGPSEAKRVDEIEYQQ